MRLRPVGRGWSRVAAGLSLRRRASSARDSAPGQRSRSSSISSRSASCCDQQRLLAQQLARAGCGCCRCAFFGTGLPDSSFSPARPQQADQALAAAFDAQLRGLDRFVHHRDAFAEGAAQVGLGGVGLGHRAVAARRDFGRGPGVLLRPWPAPRRRRAPRRSARAATWPVGAAALGVELGARVVHRMRRQRVAADLAAVLVPAIELLACAWRFCASAPVVATSSVQASSGGATCSCGLCALRRHSSTAHARFTPVA